MADEEEVRYDFTGDSSSLQEAANEAISSLDAFGKKADTVMSALDWAKASMGLNGVSSSLADVQAQLDPTFKGFGGLSDAVLEMEQRFAAASGHSSTLFENLQRMTAESEGAQNAVGSLGNEVASATRRIQESTDDASDSILREIERVDQLKDSFEDLGATDTTTNLEAALADLTARAAELGYTLEQNVRRTQVFRQLEKEAAQLGYSLKAVEGSGKQAFAGIANSTKVFQNSLSKLLHTLGELTKKALGLGPALVKSGLQAARAAAENNKQHKNLLATLGKMLKRIIVYRILRGLITSTANALKEGFQDMARQNEYFNNTMTELTSSFRYLQASAAAAVAPLLNALYPALVVIIDTIAKLLNYLGMLIAALTGATVFLQAKKVTEDYAESLDKAGSSAKKAAKQFQASFDELNVFSEAAASAAGAGADQEFKFVYEEVGLPDWLTEFADKLKELEPDLDYFFNLGKSVGEAINRGLAAIPWEEVRTFAESLAQKLAAFLNGAIEATDWELFGSTLANALNTSVAALNAFARTFNFIAFGRSVGDTINGFFRNIDAVLLADTFNLWAIGILDAMIAATLRTDWGLIGTKIQELLSNIQWREIFLKVGAAAALFLNGIVKTLATAAVGLDFAEFGSSIAAGINRFFTIFNFGELAAGINRWGIGLLNALLTALSEIRWFDIGKSVGSFISNIDWYTWLQTAAKTISAAIRGILQFALGTIIQIDWDAFGRSVSAFITAIDWFGIWSDAWRLIGAIMFDAAPAALQGFVDQTVQSIGSMFGADLTEQAGDIASGLINALDKELSTSQFTGPWVTALKTIRSILGIHSPSTETYDMGLELINGLVNALNASVSLVNAPIQQIVENIKQAFNSGFGYAGAYYVFFLNLGKGIGQSIVDGLTVATPSILSAFTRLYNGILSTTEKFMHTMETGIYRMCQEIAAMINTVMMKQVVVVPVPTLPTLPRLADGAVAVGPTVAEIGEGRYSEAIIPLENSPQMQELVSTIADAVAGRGGAGGQPIVVKVVIGGKEWDTEVFQSSERGRQNVGEANISGGVVYA